VLRPSTELLVEGAKPPVTELKDGQTLSAAVSSLRQDREEKSPLNLALDSTARYWFSALSISRSVLKSTTIQPLNSGVLS
jgi:hypothetical protein